MEFINEKGFILMKNTAEAQRVLYSKGLPVEFSEYVVAESAEETMANINVLEGIFNQSVAYAAAKEINSNNSGMTKEKFKKLSISELNDLYKTNPVLYRDMQE